MLDAPLDALPSGSDRECCLGALDAFGFGGWRREMTESVGLFGECATEGKGLLDRSASPFFRKRRARQRGEAKG